MAVRTSLSLFRPPLNPPPSPHPSPPSPYLYPRFLFTSNPPFYSFTNRNLFIIQTSSLLKGQADANLKFDGLIYTLRGYLLHIRIFEIYHIHLKCHFSHSGRMFKMLTKKFRISKNILSPEGITYSKFNFSSVCPLNQTYRIIHTRYQQSDSILS